MPSIPASLPQDRATAVLSELASLVVTPTVKTTPSPVHVVYGGAHLYKKGSAAKLGSLARTAMETWGKDDAVFGRLVGLSEASLASELAARVREKLARQAIEKTVIDFEDGYGPRPDDEEDADAVRAAGELAAEQANDGPLVGLRIKALEAATAARALRTLDAFVTTLVKANQGVVPANFTVTLPKVTRPREVAILDELLSALEAALGVAEGAIGIELMIETPRSLVDGDGRVALPSLVAAANGRCRAVHLGAYDLTASLGVSASEQRLDHPACDTARMLMQLTLAGTGIDVFDGATNILPIARHRASADLPLTATQALENEHDVQSAWSLHATAIRRALVVGVYQGWDLHPAQVPARYGALQAFFLAERAPMSLRLRSFVEKATKATRVGRVFDDAATGQGLVEFFLRGVACGALTASDVAATTLSMEELQRRSFAKIVAARSSGG